MTVSIYKDIRFYSQYTYMYILSVYMCAWSYKICLRIHSYSTFKLHFIFQFRLSLIVIISLRQWEPRLLFKSDMLVGFWFICLRVENQTEEDRYNEKWTNENIIPKWNQNSSLINVMVSDLSRYKFEHVKGLANFAGNRE